MEQGGEQGGKQSAAKTYRAVTIGDSARAHLGDAHIHNSTIIIQQLFILPGQPPSELATAPKPFACQATRPLYSSPRVDKSARRPRSRAPNDARPKHSRQSLTATDELARKSLPSKIPSQNLPHQPPTCKFVKSSQTATPACTTHRCAKLRSLSLCQIEPSRATRKRCNLCVHDLAAGDSVVFCAQIDEEKRQDNTFLDDRPCEPLTLGA